MTKKRGIWFYGYSGSGKTYASNYVSKIIPINFVLDGDHVRQFVSKDLKYTLRDRNIQIARIAGIAQIVLQNNLFPIISSVTMSETILAKCMELNIDVAEIQRPYSQRAKVRSIYENSQNVVGNDIKQPSLVTNKIENDGTELFTRKLRDYVFEQINI